MNVDLQKKLDLRKQLVLDISKKKGIENQKAQVILCLDISGSMDSLYSSGFVQQVLERIVPVAMQFDDNGEMELYLFESNCKKHGNPVTVKNVDGLIRREIYGHYEFGGTSYAPPINMIASGTAQAQGSSADGLYSNQGLCSQLPPSDALKRASSRTTLRSYASPRRA